MRLQVIVMITIVISAATVNAEDGNAENEHCFDAGLGWRRFEIKKVLDVKSPKACQILCQGNRECVVWTYDNHERDSKKPDCQLHKAEGFRRRSPDIISGPRVCPNPCFDGNVEVQFNNVSTGMTGIESLELCQRICQIMDVCNYFVYEEANATCYFKSDYKNTTSNKETGAISGPKFCPGDCYKYGISYQGNNDITTKIHTRRECQKACQNTAACVAWTWKRIGLNIADNMCTLVTEKKFRETSEMGVTSGPKYCPDSKNNIPPATNSTEDCSLEHVDYFGNDVRPGIGGVQSTKMCQMLCQIVDGCYKWVYVTEKYPKYTSEYCYFKGKYNGLGWKNESISGPKFCADPEPDPYTAVNATSGGCYRDNIKYNGYVSKTMSGKECVNWEEGDPDINELKEFYIFPESDASEAVNYCRNLRGFEKPWCITKDPKDEFNDDYIAEDCDIPICGVVGDCFIEKIMYYRNHSVEDFHEERQAYSAAGCQKFCQDAPGCVVWTWQNGRNERGHYYNQCNLLSKSYIRDETRANGTYVDGYVGVSGPEYCPEIVDKDQCMAECDPNANCMTSGTGESAKCVCDKGYTGDGIHYCVKGQEECTLLGHICHHDASCEVAGDSGSFHCACNTGYEGNGIWCKKVVATDKHCHADNDCSKDGSSWCRWIGNHTVCMPKDEYLCTADDVHACGEHARCVFFGSSGRSKCICESGYTGDGKICQSIDHLCTADDNECDEHASCVRFGYSGSSKCICDSGYAGDGKICESIQGLNSTATGLNSTATA